MSASQPFNPRLVVGMIAAGLVAFAAMLLLIAYGGGLGSGREGRAHALSIAATGYKGLVSLVGERNATYLIRDSYELESENLVVVALEPQSRPEAVAELLGRRQALATLIVLPKWNTVRDPARRGWVRHTGAGAGVVAEFVLDRRLDINLADERPPADFVEGEGILTGLRVPVPRRAQLIDGSDVTTLIGYPGGGALLAQLGERPHYVLADPDLVNNFGLRDPERARAAVELIEALSPTGADGVDFDVTVNGLGTSDGRNLLRLAFEPPFLALTLATVAAALLAGLHGAFRFGPVRREERAIAFGKAALVENSAGLIRQAEREARLGAAYADVVRQDLARLTAAPLWLQGGDLDLYLNRLGRADRPHFSELAARLDAARDRHGLMAAARELFQWKKEVIR